MHKYINIILVNVRFDPNIYQMFFLGSQARGLHVYQQLNKIFSIQVALKFDSTANDHVRKKKL